MFEHRLGLALGKSVEEVRNSMTNREFKSWQMFYLIEPWGWHDQEYRTAVLLEMLVNINTAKKSERVSAKDFIRDMPKLLEDAYRSQLQQDTTRDRLLKANITERKQMIARALGTIVKDVHIVNSSNNSS